MSKEYENSGSNKLNKALKITIVIFILSGIIALFIILNKGILFGKRLISVSDEAVAETHKIELTSDKVYLPEGGEKASLTVSIDGVEALEGYTLTSSDESVAQIVGNTVISGSEGTAIITATNTEYNITSEVTIDVVEPITSITLSSEYTYIEIDETSQLTYKYKPTTATANIKYSSSDESILKVDEHGVATGVSYGTATVTVTDEVTGFFDEFDITVRPEQ